MAINSLIPLVFQNRVQPTKLVLISYVVPTLFLCSTDVDPHADLHPSSQTSLVRLSQKSVFSFLSNWNFWQNSQQDEQVECLKHIESCLNGINFDMQPILQTAICSCEAKISFKMSNEVTFFITFIPIINKSTIWIIFCYIFRENFSWSFSFDFTTVTDQTHFFTVKISFRIHPKSGSANSRNNSTEWNKVVKKLMMHAKTKIKVVLWNMN